MSSLRSSLLVLIPSLIAVLLTIIVSSGIGCSRYSYYRASVDPCALALPSETFDQLVGSWSPIDDPTRTITFDNMTLCDGTSTYKLVRKSPGHYLLRENTYNWKGILVTMLQGGLMTLCTNDGNYTQSYQLK